MKQKDIVLIIVVCFVSAILSLVLSNLLITNSGNRQQKAEIVDAITDQFTLPDKKYFNNTAINPTKPIRIGDGSNTAPFNQ